VAEALSRDVVERQLSGAAAEQHQQHRSDTILRFDGRPARLQVGCKNSFVPTGAWLVYVKGRDQETPYVPGAARTPIIVDAGGFIVRRGAARG
jgi:hypothetical protein